MMNNSFVFVERYLQRCCGLAMGKVELIEFHVLVRMCTLVVLFSVLSIYVVNGSG